MMSKISPDIVSNKPIKYNIIYRLVESFVSVQVYQNIYPFHHNIIIFTKMIVPKNPAVVKGIIKTYISF